MKMRLTFTGNWFIDAGILGFVNLMEEIYGETWKDEWKKKNTNKPDWRFNFLEYLNEKIKENEELVYYGYFPFAYIFDNIRFQLAKTNSSKIEDIKEYIEKIKTNFLKDVRNEDIQHIFEKTWSFIDKICKHMWVEKKLSILDQEKSKIQSLQEQRNFEDFKFKVLEIKELIISKEDEIREILRKKRREKVHWYELESSDFPKIKKKIMELRKNLEKWWEDKDEKDKELLFFRLPISNNFFTNFLIFQESWSYNKQKDGFKDLIDFNIVSQPTFLGKLDKFVNKFLPSEKEFSNINYTQFSTKSFKNQIEYFFVYLLCFTHAFENFKNVGNVLFYSSDLKFTYLVNKKLKIKKRLFENKEKKSSSIIFKATWNEIIDTLVEYKSEWSLENMYIIRYRKLDNQTQEDIEYIGIPKLQAQVLLDDRIRNALNVYLQIRGKNFKGPKSVWLLEEFIKGKPLYEASLRHIRTRLNGGINKLDYSIFYALLLDAAILEFKEKQSKSLFSDEFLSQNYREIVKKLKTEFSYAFYYTTQDLPQYIEGKDEKERVRVAYLLLNSLYGNDKGKFLEILLKQLNNTKKIINEYALNWIFNKIINNNISWKEYALLLTAGLVYKNE